ncbi:hypothetical protein LSH36_412g02055 [Paralvinella palmiformis]|uniref:Uncharacterized protein n=1 Tax=Paralvinella palmiformis TaxID=53620 RepID=A0AAD9JBV1_9ANNE|nr:hypothetical protein LSH36_412g02055 [Paralvinella palmiformis]
MLGCMYRIPTSSPGNDDKFPKHESNSRGPSQVIFMRYFNNPEIDWNTKTTDKGIYHRSQLFLDAVRDACLIQRIYTPTRCRYGQNLTSSSQVKTTWLAMWSTMQDGFEWPCNH